MKGQPRKVYWCGGVEDLGILKITKKKILEKKKY